MRLAEPLLAERLYAVSGRFFLISIGLFSACWAIITFPVFWSDARLDYTADRILDGEQFKRAILQILLADADSAERTWPRPESLRSAAIIRLRLNEQSSNTEGAAPLAPIVDQLSVAESIRRSLSAAPADPFLWLALFRSKTMKGDRRKEDFAYLRMSYLVGPHEGWVAVERNPIAVAIFQELPHDLAEMAVTEFKDLVASEYYDTAVQILVGPGWRIRDKLLRRLGDAPVEARRQFAQSADQLGYDDIVVPGVERPDPRPWR